MHSIDLSVTSFLPGEDNLMLIKITGESVKFYRKQVYSESFLNSFKYELTALQS